jgi:hypothetical protein
VTKLTGPVLANLLSITAAVRLYLSLPTELSNEFLWQIGTALICFCNVAAILWEVYSYFRSAPKRFRLSQQDKIRSYMIRWLKSGGRAVIFTRDMSWVDESVKGILLAKARQHELTICIEHQLPIADELLQAGANVISYADLGVVPQSRYTIIDFEKHGARVAVGGAVGKYHVIQEFRDGEHPFFAVAEDLAKILIAYQRRAHAAPR